MVEAFCALVSAASLIIVAVISNHAGKDRKAAARREARREKETRLSMSMMMAAIELGDISAIALQGGKLNGNVEAARRAAAQAKQDYESWLLDVAAEDLNKKWKYIE